jgi:hypothetical protein
LLELVGIDQQLTLSYSKEENSLVERSNKEVNRSELSFASICQMDLDISNMI